MNEPKGKQNIRLVISECVKDLIDNNVNVYDKYNSVLEYCDENFSREFYKTIDPNDLIHECMRYSLDKCGKESEIGSWVISGIMECYDFVHNTNNDSTPNNGSKTDSVFDD